mgnify:CR=1 FL=1
MMQFYVVNGGKHLFLSIFSSIMSEFSSKILKAPTLLPACLRALAGAFAEYVHGRERHDKKQEINEYYRGP